MMNETEDQKIIRESEESLTSHSSSSSSSSKSKSSSKSGSKVPPEETKSYNISTIKESKPPKELRFNVSNSHDEQSLLQSPITHKNKEDGEEEEEGVDYDMSFSPTKSPLHKQIDKMEIYLQQEEDIIHYCKENERLWMDESFPSDARSLFKNHMKIPEWAKDVKTIKWMRPHEISKDAKFLIDREGDVKQGAFGESAFIGGIVIIATRGDFLEKLFIDFDHFELGFVTFQFFKNGEWKQVIVDTLLPFDPDSKQICYSQCANPSEFWVPLMEKAYAKLHGCYENIIDHFLMLEGLIDLTGGVAECFTLTEPDAQKLIENNHLWQTMMTYFHQKFYLGCINVVEGKSTKNPDASSRGIFENYYYGILDIREFPKENLKLIRIRNPWGPDGCWNGPFSDDSDEWDKHRNLRDELRLVFKSKKSDGTWWMSFNDWCVHFNKMFVCKVFPENWQNYSIESRWQGKTAGGVCPKRMEYEGNEPMPEFLQLDSDDRWFNNPQFRIKVQKETKLYINLMQEDEKLCKSNYIKCNFIIVANHSRKNRIWERPAQSDIIAEAVNKNNIENPPSREITHQVTLRKFEGKPFGYYMIIPNAITESRKEEQRPFWLRLFSSDPIDVFEMPTTIEQTIEDSWNEMNAGGKRKIENKDNPSWCRNPQYFLNLKNPTNLKIILKKTGNVKKFKGVKIGLTICRYLLNLMDFKALIKGEPLKKNNKSVAVRGITRLLAQTKGHLEPPEMDFIERKLQILQGEKFRESTYFSDEVASLYFNWNPTEGPFIIIPSLDHEEKTSNYKLTIYSDNPIEIKKLDEKKNAVLIGKWEHDISDGGCHLYEDPFEKDVSMKTWTNNPKYLLKFDENESGAILKITLAIAEKNWKSKTKNSVGGMIGIYLLEKRENKLTIENLVSNREPSFMPLNVICENYVMSGIKGKSYFIMPSTFEHATKPETLDILKIAIQNEYLEDLSSQKLHKLSTLPEILNFSDVTSWIYQKTYTTSTLEAKKLWSLLCHNDETIEEMRFDDFFRQFAELLYTKHQKTTNLRRKNQKILKLIKRTNRYNESLDNLQRELGYKAGFHENRLLEKGKKCGFLINVDCLENFDMANIFKDKDYLGHHIELGYKESVVFTPTEPSNGRIVNFRKIQLGLNLDYMTGNIFINIYEDFLRETRIDKNLVARRNLDLFSSLSRAFIVKILLKELRDEALLKKFTSLFEELALEEDEDKGEESGNLMRNNKDFVKENNIRLLKEEGKMAIIEDQAQNNSHNLTHDLSESDIRSEKFKLFKTNSPIHNPYVSLKLYISCENLKGLDDLGQYTEMMELRKDFLTLKAEKTLGKINGYKNILGNLVLPLRCVVLTENDIRVDKKFLKSMSFLTSGDSIGVYHKKHCCIF